MTDQTFEADLGSFLDAVRGRAKSKRWRWAAVGLVLFAALLSAYSLQSGDTQKSYATAQVTRGDLEVKVSATGNLAPTNQISVGSEQSGMVETVLVDVNDRVVRGQPLAQLDTSRLRDSLARSRAALAQSEAGVAQAQATVRQSSANLARLREVFRISGGKVPSSLELDNAEAEHDRAVSSLRSAQAQVTSAKAQLSSDMTNLNKATIRSPVTGVVLSREIEPGQTVAASFNTPTLFTIAEDLAAMELEVKVDEADVGQVAAGQAATFTVDAYPGRKFTARILRVNLGSNSSSSTSTSSSSTVISYSAVLSVSNSDLILRPDMTATADILTSEQKNVLLVPNTALRFQPAKEEKQGGTLGIGMPPPGANQRKSKEAAINRGTRQTIYTLDDNGNPRAIEVTAGASNGGQTVISGEGVSSGLVVITGEMAQAE